MDTALFAVLKALLATYNPGNAAAPQLIPSSLIAAIYPAGAWNPSTNIPPLRSGQGSPGAAFLCSGAGTTDVDGNATWASGDYAIFNPDTNTYLRLVAATGRLQGKFSGQQLSGTDILLGLAGSGFKMAGGVHTQVAASDTIVTGLASVAVVLATLGDDPVAGCQFATASIGDQAGAPAAGSVLVKVWKATASGDTALIAGTTFGKKVNWMAFGSA